MPVLHKTFTSNTTLINKKPICIKGFHPNKSGLLFIHFKTFTRYREIQKCNVLDYFNSFNITYRQCIYKRTHKARVDLPDIGIVVHTTQILLAIALYSVTELPNIVLYIYTI